MLGTVPTTDARTALCCLTTAPKTARHGESSTGPCSLGINEQDHPLPGSCSLRTGACRAPHDGSASASTGPRFSRLSTLWHQHVARRTRHTLRQAARAPTSRTGPSSCILGISTLAPSHQPGLGTPHRSNLQRPARLQRKKARLPPQEPPHRVESGVTGASLQCIKDKIAPSTTPSQ